MRGLTWFGDALCLVAGRASHEALAESLEAESAAGIPPGASVLRGPWPEGVLVEPTAPPVVPDPPES